MSNLWRALFSAFSAIGLMLAFVALVHPSDVTVILLIYAGVSTALLLFHWADRS